MSYPTLNGRAIVVRPELADVAKFCLAAQALEIMGLYGSARAMVEAAAPDATGKRIQGVRHILGLEAECVRLFTIEAREALGVVLSEPDREVVDGMNADEQRGFWLHLGTEIVRERERAPEPQESEQVIRIENGVAEVTS